MKGLLLLIALLFAAPAAAQTAERAYGDHPGQRLDFTPAEQRAAPLVLFVHGGAWTFGDKRAAAHMAPYFHRAGYAFASVNYRLVPGVAVADQARDVAAALASLLRDARALGIDRERIVLMGHSAGAHLAALVGTDPAYLGAHHIPLSAIDGIVLLDGAGYDVERQMADAGPFLRRLYVNAFGTDAAAHRLVSPARHAATPNAGAFLILHISSRTDSAAQSGALATALRAAGTPAEVEAVEGSHAEIFRRFGQPGHRPTALVNAFAHRLFGPVP